VDQDQENAPGEPSAIEERLRPTMIRRLTSDSPDAVSLRTTWQDEDDDDLMEPFSDIYNSSERMAIKRRLGSDGGANSVDSDGGSSSDASSPHKQQRAGGAASPAGSSGSASLGRLRRAGSASRERYHRRLESNERERIRMHGLNAAFNNLQEVIPPVSMERKMSKIETLTLARNYIMALTNVICDIQGGVKPFSFLDEFAPTSEQQLDDVMSNFRLGVPEQSPPPESQSRTFQSPSAPSRTFQIPSTPSRSFQSPGGASRTLQNTGGSLRSLLSTPTGGSRSLLNTTGASRTAQSSSQLVNRRREQQL